jgi:hypothetical protein
LSPARERFWILSELDAERRRLALSYRSVADRLEPRATERQRRALRARIYRTLIGTRADLVLVDRIASLFGLDLDLIPQEPAKVRRRA